MEYSVRILYVAKTPMSKTRRLEIKLEEWEYERLKDYAKSKNVSMAQILRWYIARLPAPGKSTCD